MISRRRQARLVRGFWTKLRKHEWHAVDRLVVDRYLRVRLPCPPHLARIHGPTKLGFDRDTESVRTVGMPALHMPADGVQFVRLYRVDDQSTVDLLTFSRIAVQRQIRGVLRDQRVVLTGGIAAMARPDVVRRVRFHGGALRRRHPVAQCRRNRIDERAQLHRQTALTRVNELHRPCGGLVLPQHG